MSTREILVPTSGWGKPQRRWLGAFCRHRADLLFFSYSFGLVASCSRCRAPRMATQQERERFGR